MQFPNDENGDVLRRMADSGFDFEQRHDVDFFVVFPGVAAAERVTARLAAADTADGSLRSMSTQPQGDGNAELTVVKRMLVTHENVTAYELVLADLCAQHGGKLDGWGVLQSETGDQATARRGRLDQPTGELDDGERHFVDGIREHGWMQTDALEEDGKPGFSFTTGFAASIGQPELISFKLGKKVANRTFWLIYRCAQNGRPVPLARRVGGLLPNDDVYVFPVARRFFAAYLGWSRWFYRGDDFECLQLVWPDEAGLFPWEDGFDPKYAGAQVDLTENGWALEATD